MGTQEFDSPHIQPSPYLAIMATLLHRKSSMKIKKIPILPIYNGVCPAEIWMVQEEGKFVAPKSLISYVYLVRENRARLIFNFKNSIGYKVISIVGKKGNLGKGSRVSFQHETNILDESIKVVASQVHRKIHKKDAYKIVKIESKDRVIKQQLGYLTSIEPCLVPKTCLKSIEIIDSDMQENINLLEL